MDKYRGRGPDVPIHTRWMPDVVVAAVTAVTCQLWGPFQRGELEENAPVLTLDESVDGL